MSEVEAAFLRLGVVAAETAVDQDWLLDLAPEAVQAVVGPRWNRQQEGEGQGREQSRGEDIRHGGGLREEGPSAWRREAGGGANLILAHRRPPCNPLRAWSQTIERRGERARTMAIRRQAPMNATPMLPQKPVAPLSKNDITNPPTIAPTRPTTMSPRMP